MKDSSATHSVPEADPPRRGRAVLLSAVVFIVLTGGAITLANNGYLPIAQLARLGDVSPNTVRKVKRVLAQVA
jgi:hypothetical protein